MKKTWKKPTIIEFNFNEKEPMDPSNDQRDICVHTHALVLSDVRVEGQTPRTMVFEFSYNSNGKQVGRKVGTKTWHEIDEDTIVAEFATKGYPSDFLVRQAKKMFHANWHRKNSTGV